MEIKNLPVPRMRKPQIISPVTSVKKPIPLQSSSPRTYVVKKGDSLYAISRKLYGDSSHIERIFQANRQSLSSKNSLKLGQTLIIPALNRNP